MWREQQEACWRKMSLGYVQGPTVSRGKKAFTDLFFYLWLDPAVKTPRTFLCSESGGRESWWTSWKKHVNTDRQRSCWTIVVIIDYHHYYLGYNSLHADSSAAPEFIWRLHGLGVVTFADLHIKDPHLVYVWVWELVVTNHSDQMFYVIAEFFFFIN